MRRSTTQRWTRPKRHREHVVVLLPRPWKRRRCACCVGLDVQGHGSLEEMGLHELDVAWIHDRRGIFETELLTIKQSIPSELRLGWTNLMESTVIYL